MKFYGCKHKNFEKIDIVQVITLNVKAPPPMFVFRIQG
jgi:hypothetical protein